MRYFLSFFILFLALCSCSKSTKKIAIQPLGNVSHQHIDSIKSALSKEVSDDVVVLEAIPIPTLFFITVKSPRYRADSIIHYLKKTKNDSIDYIIGITEKDISTTKKDREGNIKKPLYKYEDWGVCGLGFVDGPSCVISTFRIKHGNKSIFFDRLKKLSVHEIGHNLGLPHCDNNNCVMRDAAESVSTIDKVKHHFCTLCKKRI